MVAFGEVISDCTKYATKIKKEEYLSNGIYPIVDQGKGFVAGYTNVGNGIYSATPSIVFGDHTRILKYIEFPLFLGADGVKLLKTDQDRLDTKFAYYYLSCVNIPDTGYNRHYKWLKETEIPLPPLLVQRKIADVLDRASAFIKKRKAQIENLDLLIKSRFVEMFGDLSNPKMGVDVRKIIDVCEKITDGTHQTPSYTDSGYIFLSSKDVKNGYIDWSDIKYISQELHDELSKRVSPRRNDILLAKNGTTGIAALVDTDEVFDIYVSLALLRPTGIINPVYLLSAINNNMTKYQFDAGLKGIGVPNLHLNVIKDVKVLVAPLEVQNRFADLVRQADTSKFTMQKSLAKLELNYKSLMQKCFRGEIF